MKKELITFPDHEFDQICAITSVQSISEQGKIKGSFFLNGKEYCVTGAVGNSMVWAVEFIDAKKYKGGAKGKSGYAGTRVTFKGKKVVLVGKEIEIFREIDNTQEFLRKLYPSALKRQGAERKITRMVLKLIKLQPIERKIILQRVNQHFADGGGGIIENPKIKVVDGLKQFEMEI